MSYCGCDLESPSVFQQTDVQQARDPHACTECRGVILPGESYRHIWGVWPTIDGPATHRICARCAVLWEYVAAHIPCACLALGDLLNSASDEIDNTDEPEVLRPEYDALVADIKQHCREYSP